MRSIYYGWYVVAALFVMLACASGLAFYNLSVYMNALVESQGFPVGMVSAAIACFFIASGIAGMAAARLLQRHDPRLTIFIGGLVGAGALLALGRVTALWQLFAVYALFGVGHAFAALVPATTLVTRWFERQRSLALSVASTGLSIGGVLITPASVALIASEGMTAASPWLAAAWFLGIVPVTALVIRAGPPTASSAEAPGQGGGAEVGWSRADAIRSRFFRCMTGAWVLVMLAQVGGISHLFNLVAGRAETAVAASAVSLMASTSIVGRFLGAFLVTRVDTRAFAMLCMLGQAAGMTVLAFGSGATMLLGGAVLFGATVGNLLMLQPLLLAEAFGVRDYGPIFSLSQLLTTFGVASGPALLGALYDLSGGYELAFTLAGVGSLVAFAILVAGGAIPSPAGPAPERPA